jgi:uncharacterized membrane protein YdjX (TVP38/TMEM64 family)
MIADWLTALLGGIAALGPWAPAVFMAVYALACVFFVPASLLTLGAGVLFGVVRGTIYVSIASVAGATTAFLVGRHLARDWVERKLEGSPRFGALRSAVGQGGWKIVLLTRLSPVFPFNLLNYAFGVTDVRLRDYFFASWLGMLPGTIMYVYIGSLAGSLAGLGAGRHSKTPAEWALYVVGLAAAVAVTLYVTRLARAALDQATRSNASTAQG